MKNPDSANCANVVLPRVTKESRLALGRYGGGVAARGARAAASDAGDRVRTLEVGHKNKREILG